MTLKKFGLKVLGNMLPASMFTGVFKEYPMLPYYHYVSDNIAPHIRYVQTFRSVKQFNEDLDFFLKNYNPISVSELLDACTKRQSVTKPSFLLSFDNGYREVYDIVAPILEKKGLPAILFVNSAFIDNKVLDFKCKSSIILDRIHSGIDAKARKAVATTLSEELGDGNSVEKVLSDLPYAKRHLYDRVAQVLSIDFDQYLRARTPYLTSDHIRSLMSRGFHIGAHSVDHPKYKEVSLEQQIWQTEESVDFVRKQFQTHPSFFAFPYNDVKISGAFFSEMFDRMNVDLSFGTHGVMKDHVQRNIQRVGMERGNRSASAIVNEQYLHSLLRHVRGKNVVVRNV